MQAEEEEEEDNNDGETASNLVSRILGNDPALTHLHLRCVTDFRTDPVPDWWGVENPDDRLYDPAVRQLIEEQIDKAIIALSQNYTITSVELDSWVTYISSCCNGYGRLVDALFGVSNLNEISFEESSGACELRQIKVAKNLKKVKIRHTLRFCCPEDLDFIESIREHPNLEVLDLETLDVHYSLSKQVYKGLLKAFLSIPHLKEISIKGLRISDPSLFVKLVQMPNLKRLILPGAGLRDAHAIAMSEALLTNKNTNACLEYVDFSADWTGWGCHPKHNRFGQEGFEALFRLVDRGHIQVRATALYVPPSEGRHSMIRCQLGKLSSTFLLNDPDAVQLHLNKEEKIRSLRLKAAGFDNLLVTHHGKNHDARVTEVMAKVRRDRIALFEVLRAHPTICDMQQTSTTKKNKKRRRS